MRSNAKEAGLLNEWEWDVLNESQSGFDEVVTAHEHSTEQQTPICFRTQCPCLPVKYLNEYPGSEEPDERVGQQESGLLRASVQDQHEPVRVVVSPRQEDLTPDDAMRGHGDDQRGHVDPGVHGEDEPASVQDPGDRMEEVDIDKEQEDGHGCNLSYDAVQCGVQEPVYGYPLALHHLGVIHRLKGRGLMF